MPIAFVGEFVAIAKDAKGKVECGYVTLNPSNKRVERYASVIFDNPSKKALLIASTISFGGDPHGDILVHESFFSLIDEQRQVVVESSQQKKKDWRDCWYGRYGYPDE